MSATRTISIDSRPTLAEYVKASKAKVIVLYPRFDRSVPNAFNVGGATVYIPKDMRVPKGELDYGALGAMSIIPSDYEEGKYFLGEDDVVTAFG